jgi:hypothetical protein
MPREGFKHMDVDTDWPYHRKVRMLQRLYPEHWTEYWAAYLALLAEAWKSGNRNLTVLDAWCPAVPSDPPETVAALRAAGIIDRQGRIPIASWRDWFEPAARRMEQYRQAGIASGEARRRATLQRRSNNGATTVQPNQPTNNTNQPNGGTRLKKRGSPTKLSEHMTEALPWLAKPRDDA